MPDFSVSRLLLCLVAGLSCAGLVSAQSEPRDEPATTESRWTGQWSAEGLTFVVQARASADRLEISPVESSGQGWVTSNGRISEDSATIEVEYQGVTATALIRLTENNTAIAQTLSCQPDYHVICTLARDQQARFHRSAPAGE